MHQLCDQYQRSLIMTHLTAFLCPLVRRGQWTPGGRGTPTTSGPQRGERSKEHGLRWGEKASWVPNGTPGGAWPMRKASRFTPRLPRRPFRPTAGRVPLPARRVAARLWRLAPRPPGVHWPRLTSGQRNAVKWVIINNLWCKCSKGWTGGENSLSGPNAGRQEDKPIKQ